MNRRVSKKQKVFRVVLILVVLIVAIRVALPYVILKYANNTLDSKLPGYRGRIHDIDLAIIRGAYKIDSIYLNKVDTVTKKETPFFAASLIDLSVEWKALLKGEIVGEVVFTKPMLRFTKDKVEPDDVKKDSTGFKQVLDNLMPLSINRFEVIDGNIQYIDDHSTPKVDIHMTNTDIIALNLRNSYDSAALLPSSLYAKANIYDGTLTLNVKLNPLAEEPTFDLNAELKDTKLIKVNDFFKAYAKLDVNAGTFGLYTELAAKDGRFNGYIKPLLKDLDILGHEDRKDNIFRKAWEAVAGGIGEVFENQPKDRIATKIPLQGSVKSLDTNVWYAIGVVLQNAFIQALQPSIDQEISIATVGNAKDEKKNILEKVFGGKDKKDDKKKDKKD